MEAAGEREGDPRKCQMQALLGDGPWQVALKFFLEHKFPKRLRYAKFFFQAGPTSVRFSLDGTSADWHASIGKKRSIEMTDAEYARFRAQVPAVQLLDGDGDRVLIRNAAGYEELWERPRWVLERSHKALGR